MMKLTALVIALTVACALADEPTIGDVGTISKCVATDDDNNECRTCFEEREEEEEEGDEKVEAGSDIQKCVDMCSSSGYRIEQLEEGTYTNIECEMNGGEDCEETVYQRIALTHDITCVNGCSCPNATGFMEKPEANDEEAADEDQQYILKFFDESGEPNTAFTGGTVEIKAAGDDGAAEVNQVTLEIKYFVVEIKDDDAAEEEQKEMDCRLPFFIATGKVGGTAAVSGAPVAEKAPVANVVGTGQLVFTSVSPASCGEFEAGTTEFCFAYCTQRLKVHTTNASFTMVPDDGYADNDCECQWGKGQQMGTGEAYEMAQVVFGENFNEMCSSKFDSEQLLEVNVKNVDHNNAFTIEWKTSDATTCVSSYTVTKGSALGRVAVTPSSSGGNGGAVAGIIIGVLVVVGVIIAVVKRKGGKRSYQGIP